MLVTDYNFLTADINSAVKQSITNTVTSAVATVVDVIQTKHKEEMLALWEIIKKSLLFRNSSSSTFLPDSNAFSKALPPTNLLSKATNKWNQSDLNYFNPHLDTKVYGIGKVISVGKNDYYRNVVLFVQCIQNLVMFKGATLVKANIPTSLRRSVLKWYTSKLAEFNHDILNNNPNLKS